MAPELWIVPVVPVDEFLPASFVFVGGVVLGWGHCADGQVAGLEIPEPPSAGAA